MSGKHLTLAAVSAVAGLVFGGASRTLAAVIPLTDNSSLASLIAQTNPGGVPGGVADGVQVGDKIFYNFGYSSSSDGVNPAPTASQISVSHAHGPNVGLSFTAGWFSAEGYNQDSVISYQVHTADSTVQQLIDGVALDFNGTAPVAGTQGKQLLTAATVTETVYGVNANGTPNTGQQLAKLSTFDDGGSVGDPGLADSAFAGINPPQRDIAVTKDINVHSIGTSDGGGVATISIVDNTYHQTTVPEPAALGLLAMAFPMLRRSRRN